MGRHHTPLVYCILGTGFIKGLILNLPGKQDLAGFKSRPNYNVCYNTILINDSSNCSVHYPLPKPARQPPGDKEFWLNALLCSIFLSATHAELPLEGSSTDVSESGTREVTSSCTHLHKVLSQSWCTSVMLTDKQMTLCKVTVNLH